MSERIPVQVIEVTPSLPPIANKPLSASSGPIHTRRFTGFYRDLRRLGAGLLCLLFFGTLWLDWDGRRLLWGEQRIVGGTFQNRFHVRAFG